MIVFKYSNQSAYKRFRECMQVLDLACLDSGILKLTPRTAAAGLLYLMISKYFYETQYTLLYYTGPDFQESAACLAINEFSNISLCFGDGETGPVALEDHTEAQNFENASVVQELFAGFVSSAAEIKNVEDIYEAVAFFHPFLEFEVVFELPLVCKVQSKAKLESHYEEFLAYQTHNINNVEFLSQQLRGKSVTNK